MLLLIVSYHHFYSSSKSIIIPDSPTNRSLFKISEESIEQKKVSFSVIPSLKDTSVSDTNIFNEALIQINKKGIKKSGRVRRVKSDITFKKRNSRLRNEKKIDSSSSSSSENEVRKRAKSFNHLVKLLNNNGKPSIWVQAL